MTSYLKILPLFMMVMPGMISRVLFPGECTGRDLGAPLLPRLCRLPSAGGAFPGHQCPAREETPSDRSWILPEQPQPSLSWAGPGCQAGSPLGQDILQHSAEEPAQRLWALLPLTALCFFQIWWLVQTQMFAKKSAATPLAVLTLLIPSWCWSCCL